MTRPGPTPRRARTLAPLAVCALGVLQGCCLLVTPPRAEDYLALGFRTPEQAFRAFQVGWRADEPDLEHRCLSRDFRRRNQVSRLNYREFRAQLLEDEPLLRLGIADAEPKAPAEIRGDRAQLVLESHGHWIEVAFVLDDFVEVHAGAERVLDEYSSFEAHTQTTPLDVGGARFWAHVDLPAGTDPARVTEVRLGREWKIDDLRVVDAR
ncbi:MAG: hypothetical protein U1F29_04775 [Planctomycetota bacterium]